MNIQKLRLQRGWSQQQLAELSGLSSRTIQRIENWLSVSVESLKSLASVCTFIPFFGAEWERKQVEKQLGRPL